MKLAMLNNSPTKNFQAIVNQMIVHRSVVTSRFNQKIASGKRKLASQTATNTEIIDTFTEFELSNVCAASETAMENANLELPIACPVPREENMPAYSNTEKALIESPKKTSFLSKLLSLESKDS